MKFVRIVLHVNTRPVTDFELTSKFQNDSHDQGRIYSNLGPVQKKMWGPHGRPQEFLQGGEPEGLGYGSPPAVSRGEALVGV